MSATDERFMIYSALALLCSTVSAFIGVAAGVWSFIQIAAVVEFLYWMGLPGSNDPTQSRHQ